MNLSNYRVMFQGLDALHVVYCGKFNFSWWEGAQLKEKKRVAQEKRDVPYVEVRNELWEVSPKGTQEYAYCLMRNGWRIYLLSTRGIKPNVIQLKIEIPSSRLRLGIEGLNDEFRVLAMSILSSSTEGIQRVDLTADVAGFHMDDLNRYFFYGYPSKMKSINSDLFLEKFYSLGKESEIETVVIGKNPQLRIYDKKKLSLSQDPDWFECWFGMSFEEVLKLFDGDIQKIPEITRFEFQLRTQVLKEFQISSYEVLIEKLQGLWDYMAFKWLEFKIDNPNIKCKRKLPIAPIWAFIGGLKFNGNLQLKRLKPYSHDSSKNFQQFLGHFSSFLAKEGIKLEWENEEEFKKKVLQIIEIRILDSEKINWELFLAKFHKKYNHFQGI